MVRNNKGGKNSKKMSRKHINADQTEEQKKARVPAEEGEFFACSTKLLGNGMVLVVDFSGKEYICIIRKKFKGRGKRQNTIQKGTCLLVGERIYENTSVSDSGKRPKCDLLEVYSDKEKQLLKNQCPEYNWVYFDTYGDDNSANDGVDELIEFNGNMPDITEEDTDDVADGEEILVNNEDDDEEENSNEDDEDEEEIINIHIHLNHKVDKTDKTDKTNKRDKRSHKKQEKSDRYNTSLFSDDSYTINVDSI